MRRGLAAGALASAMGAAAAASGVTVLKKNGDASSVVAFDASDACVAFAIEAFASASSRALSRTAAAYGCCDCPGSTGSIVNQFGW